MIVPFIQPMFRGHILNYEHIHRTDFIIYYEIEVEFSVIEGLVEDSSWDKQNHCSWKEEKGRTTNVVEGDRTRECSQKCVQRQETAYSSGKAAFVCPIIDFLPPDKFLHRCSKSDTAGLKNYNNRYIWAEQLLGAGSLVPETEDREITFLN